MANIYIQEEVLNETSGHFIYESEVYETWASLDEKELLKKRMSNEYGTYCAPLSIELEDGSEKEIGWVFQKEVKYEDSDETYLQTACISLHSSKPTKTITYHYL